MPDPDPEPAPEPEREPEPEPGPVSWEAWTPAPAPDPMPAFYWLMRREYEGDHAAPASTNSPGRGLVAAVARRAFHPEELPEMALDPGERLLILRDEYDPSPGWIFAAKGTSNAGYVPRNYLDIDDGPAEIDRVDSAIRDRATFCHEIQLRDAAQPWRLQGAGPLRRSQASR